MKPAIRTSAAKHSVPGCTGIKLTALQDRMCTLNTLTLYPRGNKISCSKLKVIVSSHQRSVPCNTVSPFCFFSLIKTSYTQGITTSVSSVP